MHLRVGDKRRASSCAGAVLKKALRLRVVTRTPCFQPATAGTSAELQGVASSPWTHRPSCSPATS
jgi:hypothetical protein